MSDPVDPLLASKLCKAFADVNLLKGQGYQSPEVVHKVLRTFKQQYEAFADACVAAGIDIQTRKEFESEIAAYKVMMKAIMDSILKL